MIDLKKIIIGFVLVVFLGACNEETVNTTSYYELPKVLKDNGCEVYNIESDKYNDITAIVCNEKVISTNITKTNGKTSWKVSTNLITIKDSIKN